MQQRSLRIITATAVLGAGFILLFGPSRLEYPTMPYVQHYAVVFDSLLTAAIFYASLGLLLGRRSSWYVALGLLATSTLWETVKSHTLIASLSLVPFTVLLFVSLQVRAYTVPSNPHTIGSALKRALVVTLITTTIGTLVFFLLAAHSRHSFAPHHSIGEILTLMYSPTTALRTLAEPHERYVAGKLLLAAIGFVNYSLFALALLRPVYDEFVPTRLTIHDVKRMLMTHAHSSEDIFKLLPHDKSYYFAKHFDGFVAYGVRDGICIALSDPICMRQHVPALIKEFTCFATDKGWEVAFLPVAHRSLPLYTQAGFSSIKIGENAVVSLSHFVKTIAGNKKFRNIRNRFIKNGYMTALLTPAHDTTILRECRVVSDAWLQRPGHEERRFAMGYMDTEYIESCAVFCVRDEHGTLQAFVTLPKSYSSVRATFDMMRFRPDAPPNCMDFALTELFTILYQEGWHEVDMGLAALSGLEASERGVERGLRLFYRYAHRWYGFKGLRRFKNKFDPEWDSTYIVYRANIARLPAIGMALIRLMEYKD